jgi:hypothetical protein
MTTYNQALAVLAEIAGAHLQIQQFGKGSLADIPEGMTYPYMWAQYEPTSVNLSNRSDKISFNILFADLLHQDKSNEAEVLSDQKQIALDVVAQLQLEAYRDRFEVEDGVTLEPIVEKFTTDCIAGWLMNITLRVDFLSDTCQVPSTLSPADEVGCPSVLVYDQSGVLIASVAAGGTYNVLSFSGIHGGDLISSYTNSIVGT